MKRILSVFLSICCLVSCGLLSACNGNRNKSKLSVVCTIFPLYDWTCNILGDKKEGCDISLLAESGVDMHSYQPSAADLVSISQCDLFIYVGGESDKWVEKALQNPVNRSRKILNLIEALGDAAKDEKTPEGADENHDHDHEDDDEHEKDEHIWLSLKNAEICLQKITAELCSIDTVNKTVYEKNSEEYSQKLNELDISFKNAVSEAEFKILVFCDRFPFRYLADDYGIDYYAAFSGCSAETEASFETIVFLANKIDELNLKTICIIESGDGRIAETVKNTTAGKNQEIVKFDSMQSINRNDISGGVTYCSVMEKNLNSLRKALGATAKEKVV